jgi:hypothetical protein
MIVFLHVKILQYNIASIGYDTLSFMHFDFILSRM